MAVQSSSPDNRETIRAERQAALDARVAEMRAEADAKDGRASAIYAASNKDSAFWTQPAYGNAAGRAFAASRNRERNKLVKASELAAEAAELRASADRMERAGARVAGDAEAARQALIAAVSVSVGEMVDTTHYGVRRVLKVNAKSVLVDGGFGPLKVEKQYIRKAA